MLRATLAKCKILHVSLLLQFINGKHLALCSLSELPLRLSPLTEDTSMITVSSCGVKLQEVFLGLEKKG